VFHTVPKLQIQFLGLFDLLRMFNLFVQHFVGYNNIYSKYTTNRKSISQIHIKLCNKSIATDRSMGVDHRVDRGTCPPYPTFWSRVDVMCFVPLLLRGTNPYYVVDLLNNDCLSSPIKHNNAQLNALNMFSGRASLGPTGRRTYSTRETPALSLRARERVLRRWEVL